MTERKSFLLRMDTALYDDVKRWADAELRSVNGQIEFILRHAVDQRRSGSTSSPSSSSSARDDVPE